MKKLFIAVLLMAASLLAQQQKPSWPPEKLDDALALINKDGIGWMSASKIARANDLDNNVQQDTGTYAIGMDKKNSYRASVWLVSTTRLKHPYSFNTNALISKLEAAGFTKTGETQWKLTNGYVKAEASFGGVCERIWDKEPAYYELRIVYDYKDPDEPKTKETIKLW